MKKSYVYFLAPLVGVAIFAGVYAQYASGHQARLDAADKKLADAKAEKVKQENIAKKVAVDAALKQQEERKKAKADKEAREAKEREDRELAVAARNKAREESRKFQDNVKRLQKELEETKKDIAKIGDDKKRSADEQQFLKEYVKKAQANTQSLSIVLERIDAADKAAEAAAKAAAEAAKAAAQKK